MESDNVNHPSHYVGNKYCELTMRVRDIFAKDCDPVNIECIQAMVSMMTVEETRGFLRGNSFKYRWRYRSKNGHEDLKKAQWYEDKLLKLEQVVHDYISSTMEDIPDDGKS